MDDRVHNAAGRGRRAFGAADPAGRERNPGGQSVSKKKMPCFGFRVKKCPVRVGLRLENCLVSGVRFRLTRRNPGNIDCKSDRGREGFLSVFFRNSVSVNFMENRDFWGPEFIEIHAVRYRKKISP